MGLLYSHVFVMEDYFSQGLAVIGCHPVEAHIKAATS